MTTKRLFVVLFVIALFTMAVRETIDPDMWWHLRTGEYILENGIPRQDVFSFTVPDYEWTTHEWLSQLFMWGVYELGGLSGLIVVFAAITAVSFWLIYLVTPGRPYLAAFIVLLAAFASAIVWGARPQMFNLLGTAAFVFIVTRYQNGKLSRRVLWALPLVTILWANFHSGYLLGIVYLATVAIGERADKWITGNSKSAMGAHPGTNYPLPLSIVLVSFLAAAINVNGPELWIYPFFTLNSPAMQTYIQEWHSPDFHQPYFWPFIVLAGVGVISWAFSRERPSITDLLLFGGTAAAGLLSARNIPVFAMIVPPLICRHLLSSLQATAVYPLLAGTAEPQTPPNRVMVVLNWSIILLAGLTALGWTASKVANNDPAIAEMYPVSAVAYLKETGLAAQHGYNSYNWGGYLIWHGIPVFVDGRADVYGDEFLFYYRQAFDVAPNWAEPLDDYAVAYVLMERGAPLTAVLAASGQWQETYGDDLAQIFIRND